MKDLFGRRSYGPFGGPGNTIEDLVWRIGYGKEITRRQPRNVVLFIGTNNLGMRTGDPVPQMNFLIKLVKNVYPTSNIVVLNALPRTRYDVRRINAGFKSVARKNKVTFSSCGSSMNPRNRRLFPDGLHPSTEGYSIVIPCLMKHLV